MYELNYNYIVWRVNDTNLEDSKLGFVNERMNSERFKEALIAISVDLEDSEVSGRTILRYRISGNNFEDVTYNTSDLIINNEITPNMYSILSAVSTYYNREVAPDTQTERHVRWLFDLLPEAPIYAYHLLSEGLWFQGLLQLEEGVSLVMIGERLPFDSVYEDS